LKFYLEYFAILLIFIVPPIAAPFFTPKTAVIYFTGISPWSAICFVAALAIYADLKGECAWQKKIGFRNVFFAAEVFKTFGFLCLSAAFFEAAGLCLKLRSQTQMVFPSTFLQGGFCAANLAVSAFSEEVIYRAYLPLAIKKIFGEEKKISQACAEIFSILIFGAAHVSNGILAILNALFAGFALRICFKKTRGIWAGFFAHFSYNALTLIMLIFA
ncbi:MAG: CPBP family intramembrane metalloprotease, partial [Treponemataceae bacterium]|nr:CPBP family intramembrane metalloprotease [Treponemataceae bacterium]